MITLEPRGHRVIVERLEKRQFGAIITPDTAKQQLDYVYKVIALGGPKVAITGQEFPLQVKVGDEILFHGSGAIEFPACYFSGRHFAVVDGDDIFAVVNTQPDPPQILIASKLR